MALLLTATADDSDLLLFFDEGVKAGSGNIEIRNAKDDSLVRSIVVTDTTQVGFVSNQMLIDPLNDLPEGYTYYVTFGSGVVLDLENNPFEGIASPSVFQFTVPHYVTGTTAGETLNAGPANDIINGQLGADVLVGGPGDDAYIIGNYEGGATSLHMYSEPDETIGGDLEKSFVADPSDFNYGLGDNNNDGLVDSVGFSLSTDDIRWDLFFTTAHLNTNFAPGTYSGGLDVRSSQGATPIFGSFTVHAAQFQYSPGVPAVPLSLSISFEQRVFSDTNPTLFGILNYKYPSAGPVTIDQVIENTGEGIDTVRAAINYTLPNNVENLTLTGYAHVNGTGNSLDNVIIGNRGDNILSGGLGTDTAEYPGDPELPISGINANLADGIVTTAYYGTDTLIDIENVSGGPDDDAITGDDGANVLSGKAGDDELDGGAGEDWILGDSGDDSISGGLGNDELSGDAGDDSILGSVGNDEISGGDGIDLLDGGSGSDTLNGGSNIDTAVFSGLRAVYAIAKSGLGGTISGPDGADAISDIEFLQFDDMTIRFRPGTGSSVDFNAPPTSYMTAIRDFDGNDLGGSSGWVRIGAADVQDDGDLEHIYVNRTIGRWATVGPDENGLVYFNDHGWAGDTRVVGIYIDPLVEGGFVTPGSDHDSQRRFQNDLRIENINKVLDMGDYDHDGLQEIYFGLTDRTAYLHAYMHADGNIRYANYQSQADVIDYLSQNGFQSSEWSPWLYGT